MLKKILLILFRPKMFFEQNNRVNVTQTLPYFFVLATFYSILLITVGKFLETSVLGAQQQLFNIGLSSKLVILPLLLVLVLIHLLTFFIISMLFHLFVLIFKGKHDFAKTFMVVVYSATPTFLLGWIPYLSYALVLYNAFIFTAGISVWHHISRKKALVVFLGPLMMTALLAILFVLLTLALGFQILKSKFVGF